MSLVDPTIPLPQQVLPPEARQAAYQQLLAGAASRSDRGDSSQMMADILNRVDMDRAGRIGSMWTQRANQYGAGASTMLDAVGAANAAARAKWGGTGGSQRRGGGGRSAPRVTTTNLNMRQPSLIEMYVRNGGLSGGSALKMHMR